MWKNKKEERERHLQKRPALFIYLFSNFCLCLSFKSCQKLDGTITEYTEEPSFCFYHYCLIQCRLLQMKPRNNRCSQSPNNHVMTKNTTQGARMGNEQYWSLKGVNDHDVPGYHSLQWPRTLSQRLWKVFCRYALPQLILSQTLKSKHKIKDWPMPIYWSQYHLKDIG